MHIIQTILSAVWSKYYIYWFSLYFDMHLIFYIEKAEQLKYTMNEKIINGIKCLYSFYWTPWSVL